MVFSLANLEIRIQKNQFLKHEFGFDPIVIWRLPHPVCPIVWQRRTHPWSFLVNTWVSLGWQPTGGGTPRLEVRMTTVLLKSTVLPLPSVSRPSSNTWRPSRIANNLGGNIKRKKRTQTTKQTHWKTHTGHQGHQTQQPQQNNCLMGHGVAVVLRLQPSKRCGRHQKKIMTQRGLYSEFEPRQRMVMCVWQSARIDSV